MFLPSRADFYIRFHFIQFLKLYHNPQRDHQALFLCRQHMDTLLVLAGCKACPHIRHRFHQLSGASRWRGTMPMRAALAGLQGGVGPLALGGCKAR